MDGLQLQLAVSPVHSYSTTCSSITTLRNLRTAVLSKDSERHDAVRALAKELQDLDNIQSEAQVSVTEGDDDGPIITCDHLKWRDGQLSSGAHPTGTVSWLCNEVTRANKWMKAMPTDPKGYLIKGSALSLLGRWDAARETYLTGLQNCPGNKEELRRDLDKLNSLEEEIQISNGSQAECKSPSPIPPMTKSTSFTSLRDVFRRSFSLQLKKERKVEQPMATDRSLRSSYGTLKRIFHEISPTLNNLLVDQSRNVNSSSLQQSYFKRKKSSSHPKLSGSAGNLTHTAAAAYKPGSD